SRDWSSDVCSSDLSLSLLSRLTRVLKTSGCSSTQSALLAVSHLAAVLVQLFRKIWRADAALQVAGNRVIDEFRILKFQLAHDLAKFFEAFRLPQPGITGFFLRYRAYAALLVVVRRVDQTIIRQREKFS